MTPAERGPVAVLVGFMGAGKSTVGAALAELLDVDFTDTDHEIVARTGRAIADIFATDGEETFRAREAEVVSDVLAGASGVVALGGGAVLTPSVRDALRGHAVVHLTVTAEGGYGRVRTSDRPLLRADTDSAVSPQERYRALLEARGVVYDRVATVVVDTTGRTPRDIADEIARAVGTTTSKGMP